MLGCPKIGDPEVVQETRVLQNEAVPPLPKGWDFGRPILGKEESGMVGGMAGGKIRDEFVRVDLSSAAG